MPDPLSQHSSRATFLAAFPQQGAATELFKAVYGSALRLTDEEIQQIVKRALVQARKDLSS